MTMRIPTAIDAETHPARKTFDAEKRYRFVWPGQPPRVVAGDELTEITRGADLSLLGIEEVSETFTSSAPVPPPTRPTRKGDE